MHHYLRLSFILLSILGVLTGCATTSLVSSDNKIDGLLAGSEKAEDADAATGLLSSAYDLAEQLEGSRKETNATKLKVASAYLRLGSRYEKTGEFASARTMYERAGALESEADAKPLAETRGGQHIYTLKHPAHNSWGAEAANDRRFDESSNLAFNDSKQGGKKLEALLKEIAKKENGSDSEIYHKVLERLGAFYLKSGKVQSALDLFSKDAESVETKIKGDFSEQKNPSDVARLSDDLGGMANCLYSLEKFKEGELVARRLVRLEKSRKDIPDRTKGAHLALLASFQEKNGSNDACRTRLDVCSYFPSPLPEDIPTVADNLFGLGVDFVAIGGYQDALDTFDKLHGFIDFEKMDVDKFSKLLGLRARAEIRLFLDQKAKLDEVQYLRLTAQKGQLARALMVFDWAYDYLQREPPSLPNAKSEFVRAGNLFKPLSDKLAIQDYERCLLETANISVRQKNFPEAISLLKLAANCAEPYQPNFILAEVNEMTGKLQEALDLYQKSAQIAAKTAPNGTDWAASKVKIIHLLLLMKRFEDGQRIAKEVAAANLNGGEKIVLQTRCEYRLLQGELSLRQKHKEEATKYLKEAEAILSQLQLLELSLDNINLGIQLANCYGIAHDAPNYKRVTADCLDEAIRLKKTDKVNEINEMRKYHTPH